MSDPLLAFFTDFGVTGPYVGQMHVAVANAAPTVRAVDLMHDAPRFAPKPSAYLLATLVEQLPADAAVCAVVDPGVGSARPPVAVRADGRWLIGPGNGLLEIAARRARQAEWFRITWQPGWMSASFHGRDLFAPVAARLAATGDAAAAELLTSAAEVEDRPGAEWPDDLAEIIYIDGYGNAMTGIRANRVSAGAGLRIGGRKLAPACTFSDVSTGEAFCYENAVGLIEVAVNQGSIAEAFGLSIGQPIDVENAGGM